jgi:membrane dipeptidase
MVSKEEKTMNKEIKKYREIALNILKPSKKDIEKGLKLHEESIIWDAYGFAPVAAVNGSLLKDALENGASGAEMQDLTEDMMMTRFVRDKGVYKEYMEAWEASGVTCVMQNAGQEGNSVNRLLKRHARFTWVTDMLKPSVRKVVAPEEVISAKKEKAHCLCFSGNGVPLSGEFISVEEESRYIKIFFQLGTRMMHLTYNRRNLLGDGCTEPANAGLSDFGKTVIREMNRTGIIVDVAHSGQQTSIEACKASSSPVVASHSVCMSLRKHARAKTDEVITAISDTGGYIGICAVPAFLGGRGDINAFLDHICYAVKKFGAEHVSIGTDHGYVPSTFEKEHAKVPAYPRRTPWESFWAKDDPLFDKKWGSPEKLKSLIWTNWPLFTVGLVQRGLSEKQISAVIGGNVMRVCRDVRTASEFKGVPGCFNL